MKTQRNILEDCVKIPVTKAAIPFTGARVWANCYWIIVDECILMYRKHSAQCNSNQKIAETVRDRLYPGKEVRLLPVVYLEEKD